MTTVHQPTLEDAQREATEAITAVGSHVSPDWRASALDIVASVARSHGTFTADDVREAADRVELPSPHDARAWGAILRAAVTAGWIASTGRTARSRYRHGSPTTIWASRIVGRLSDAGTDDAPTPIPDLHDRVVQHVQRVAVGDEAIALLRRIVTHVDATTAADTGEMVTADDLDVYLRSARSLLADAGPSCTACQRPASIEVTLTRTAVDANDPTQEADVSRTVYRCTEHRTVAPRAGERIVSRERVQ